MSRKQFAGWGWELSDREFGQALALLGVIARFLPNTPAARGASFPLTPRRARNLIDRALQQTEGPLVWDLDPVGGLAGVRSRLTHQPPLALVAPWNASYAGYRHLELRPTRGLDNGWLFQVLQGAVEASPPHFALPEPVGRRRWNWPLRIGFTASQRSFHSSIYDGPPGLSQSVAPLTDAAVGPSRCDVLLIGQAAGANLRDLAAEPLPEAALVVVFLSYQERGDPNDARRFAARTNAAGVVLIDSRAEPTEWLRTFLRELSHRSSLVRALRLAGSLRGLLAAPRLLDTVPLEEASGRLAATLAMTAGMTRAEPMHVDAMPRPAMESLRLPPTVSVPLSAVRENFNLGGLSYASEALGASTIAAVARAAAPAIDELERRQAEERFIRAAIHVARRGDWVRRRQGFEAGGRHRIAISIGPRDSDLIISAGPVTPELEEAAGHRLTIVLSEPTLLRKPLVGSVFLPKYGSTKNVNFTLLVRRSATAVQARIIVLHRGRILQTANLRGAVHARAELERIEARGGDEAAIKIVPEANLRPGLAGLDNRTRFHSAIVLNHDGQGHPGGLAIGPGRAVSFNPDLARDAISALGRELEAAERDEAFDRKLGSPKSRAYLRLLAFQGRNLHTQVGTRIEESFGGRPERLQILSADPNTMLPVELIYDLPPPVPNPKLCPNATAALTTGTCDPKRFHVEDDEGFLDVVCPSGFWGVSKVIEREAFRRDDPNANQPGGEVRSLPTESRKTLGPLTPLLFAASDQLNVAHATELARVSKALEGLTDRKATFVDTWKAWAGQVKTKEPPLLLLLSHTDTSRAEGASLEIGRLGGTEARAVAAITKKYVNQNKDRPGPVVMLLGCTTAVPLDTFQSFTAQFLAMGASLVIGTIAPVLGRHAGRTAEALIEAFKAVEAAGGPREVPIGEALRDVRRAMLAKGILMSMSVAAYGDSDWRLPASS